MGININSIEYYNALRNEPVNWLLANIGDRIRIEIKFSVSTKFVGSTANPFTLNNTDGYIGAGWLTSPLDAFVGMEIGDTIMTFNQNDSTTGSFTIIDKLSDREIQLDTPFGDPANTIFGAMVVSLVKPITGVKYRYNFIGNNEQLTFNSKVDGSEQMLVNEFVDAADTTVLPMEFIGPLEYQIGSATIEGVTIQTTPFYENTFKIIHYATVTPFILATERINALNGLKPSYFQNLNCLKHVYNIQALYTYTDPNRKEESGWYNENFNTGVTNYAIDNLLFVQLPSLAITPHLALTGANQGCSFSIVNTTDTPFTSSTKFTVNFCKVPYDEIEYLNNNRDMAKNFVFDYATQTTGVAAVHGANFGGNMQVLKQITGSFVNSGEITVSLQVDFGSESFSIIQESEFYYYILWVSIQNPSLASNVSDKVNLIIDFDEYYVNNTDPDMIIIENKFLRHPHSDRDTEGVASLDAFPNDEVVAYPLFYIDKNGRSGDTIQLKAVEASIKAKNNSTLEEFTLDSFSLPLLSLPVVGGNQFINYELNRQFHIPMTEIRKKIKIKRRDDLDNSDKYYYEVIFPFLNRWEYWELCAGASNDFFDSSQPNNNLNHYWYHYDNGANWDVYFELQVQALKNGVLQQYTFSAAITQANYSSNARYTPKVIKSFDPDTLIQLFDPLAGEHYLLGYKDTIIQAEFTRTLGPFDPDQTTVNVRIHPFEEGGVGNSTRMSSENPSDSDTWLKSLNGDDLTELTYSGNKVTAKVKLDYTKIPNKAKFTVYARLYDFTASDPCGDPNGMQMEDGDCWFTEDILSPGTLIIVE
jgi:hypothetical protein